ncbi:Transposable element Tc3 transposase [Caligus rogercresseyi]|uniref:Transposable element Tc3 transposase n=1 Tax=Caligus rogercresseyi TaxID=217165 RepID=A0A7T8HJ31_CALRO|nr:Transposable element Tc3 transposase [Caligus rogercresseyi]
MRWSSEELAFAVEAYFSNRQSVVATQRAFRNRFNVAPGGPVLDRKSIVTWVTRSDNWEYDTTKNWSTSAHQITCEH